MRRILLAVLFLAFGSSESFALKVAIRIDQGILNGGTEDDVQVFKNIPFVAAPIGELRWRAPQRRSRCSRNEMARGRRRDVSRG